MQYALPRSGSLWVCPAGDRADVENCLREASEAYQRARRSFDRLTLTGEGSGSAYCLMLAARFMPERVVIAPLIGGEGEAFFRLVRSWEHRLFAVCAPIEVLLSEDCPPLQRKRIARLLRLTHAPEKQIRTLKSEREVKKTLKIETNCVRMIKTLA